MIKIKFFAILGLCCVFAFGHSFAEEIADEAGEVVIVEEEAAESEPALEEEVVAEEVVVAEPAAAKPEVIVVTNDAAERRANAAPDKTGGRGTGRQSMAALYEAARVGLVGAPKPVVATEEAKAALMPAIRTSSIGTATATPVSNVNIECNIGEYPKNGKCERCEQKNNPGVDWKNPGKNCKITECISEEYFLYNAKGDQPKCLKKCDIWGGEASRAWDGQDWGVCGSGEGIDCDEDFVKTREKTSASDMEYWHCIPKGVMSGECKAGATIKICEFANGRAKQSCENGFWSNCMIERLCNEGFYEDNHREVWTVNKKKDQKTGAFDCIKKK